MWVRNFVTSNSGKTAMLLPINFVRWKLMNSIDALLLLRPRSGISWVQALVVRSDAAHLGGNPLRALRVLGVVR